ncbi:MAG: CatA-like O-acetyltransferase [Candidatus Omnitrophota bacterium]
MEYIDLKKWPRRTHFEFFDRADYPYIDVTVQMDITAFLQYVKEHRYKFFPSLFYCFVKGVNETEAFRYRILADGVVKYDRIHGDITVPIEGERFAFCRVEYRENIHDFIRATEIAQEEAKQQTELVPNDWLDVVWVSCSPWFSFTSMSAPTADRRMRSIPLILAGKYYDQGGKTLLPVGLKVNHALIDGVHIGKLLSHFENSFKAPEKIFG